MGTISDLRDREAKGGGDAPMTEDEEKLRLADEEAKKREREAAEKAEAEQLAAAAKDLAQAPPGQVTITKARVQVTGGEVEVPPEIAKKLHRDAQVTVAVRGWIKTKKETTDKKGKAAAYVYVLVTEDVTVDVESIAQMDLDDLDDDAS